MPDAHKNFASSLVATAPSPATSGTSLVVTTGEGTKFPTPPFNATIWPAGATPTTANAEIVRVTAVSTDTLTITRAQESTSARTVIVGDQIVAGITAKTLTDVEGVFSGFYGDGSDGNVTISTTVTLTRDMFYDTLTINSPGILKPSGWRVYCKTALTVNTGGSVNANGIAGSGATAGTAISGNTLSGNTGAGGAGGTTTGSNAGTSGTGSLGGGTGAAGSGASGAGGVARSVTAVSASSLRAMPSAALGLFNGSGGTNTLVIGGQGGSGGGGDGTNAGGGGGSGGAVLIINARTVTNSGTISADGGAGATPAAGNTGGGAGGGGGLVIINTSTAITGSNPTAAAGTPGSGHGTGATASASSAGNVLVNVWS